MTVQTFQPARLVPSMPDGAAMLAAWAQTATSAAGLVAPLVETAFVPDHFRPRVDPRATDQEKEHARQVAIASATAAVLYGAEIGLSPMQALQGVLVIKGKVGMYAATMVALVQAAGHEVWTEDSTDSRVIVCGRRAGTQAIERQIWDIERARKAGYLSNEKYKTDPQAMLWARAASVVCRRIAQDVLKGITASSEEILDEDARDLPPAKTRTVQRTPERPQLAGPATPAAAPSAARQAPSPAVATRTERPDGPPLPGEDEDGPAAGGTGEGAPAAEVEPYVDPNAITQAQLNMLGAIFGKLDVSGTGSRQRRLAIASRLADRPLESSKDLTKAEASMVIDTLDSIAKAADGRERLRQLEHGNADPVAEQAAAEATYQAEADAQAEAEAIAQLDAAGEQYAPPPAGAPMADDPWDGQE